MNKLEIENRYKYWLDKVNQSTNPPVEVCPAWVAARLLWQELKDKRFKSKQQENEIAQHINKITNYEFSKF